LEGIGIHCYVLVSIVCIGRYWKTSPANSSVGP